MSHNVEKPNRIISVMVLLFVLLFAGLVYVRYAPTLFQTAPQTTENGEHGEEGEGQQAVIDVADMPILNMELESGTVKIVLRPDIAPNHVARIIELSESGFYDGIVFHRVINDFMAQTGDPTGTGMGGSDLPDLDAEINDRSFERATLGMARSADMNSANSQFFIVFGDASFLDGQYTLFGKVTEGMDLIDGLRKGNPQDNGTVTDPDHIVSMRLETNQ